MRLPEEPDPPLQVNILPMIDVIFAILAFVIVATLFLTKVESLPVNLPDAATAEPQERVKVTVTVNPDGQVAINKRPVEVKDVGAIVQALIAEEPAGVMVVIYADEAVNYGRVVRVMDELRRLDGAVLGIATEKPEAVN